MLTEKLLYPGNLKISPTLSADLISKEAPLHGHVTLESCQPFFPGANWSVWICRRVGRKEGTRQISLGSSSWCPNVMWLFYVKILLLHPSFLWCIYSENLSSWREAINIPILLQIFNEWESTLSSSLNELWIRGRQWIIQQYGGDDNWTLYKRIQRHWIWKFQGSYKKFIFLMGLKGRMAAKNPHKSSVHWERHKWRPENIHC